MTNHALQFGSARIELDAFTGAVLSLRHRDRDFVRAHNAGGLLQFAVPLPDYPGHTVRVHQHGTPDMQTSGDSLTMTYPALSTDHADLDVCTKITLRSTDAGLALRAEVENNSPHTLPQLVFPQLLGLSGLDDPRRTRVQLARRRILPFVELAMRVDDLWWVDHKSQCYLPYGHREFAMKWLDFGDQHSGFTLYGTDTRYTTQGLVLDKPSPTDDSLDLRWVHYPFIAPGERWDSGDFVLLGHDGDWYAGARAFADFARPTYPYRAPQRVKEGLAIRSVWPAVRSSPPTFTFAELDTFAKEAADPSYDIVELVLWHWWLHNGLPMIVDERLGSREDLERALARCTELGVKVCMFVSHNIVRDTDETPDEWRHLNAAGQPVQDNWTYGYDLLPRFRAHFIATHAMQIAAPLSASWRQAALREYETIVGMGGSSIMFDVFSGPSDPEFNPAADGRPDESGVRLIELAEAARKIIHDHDPDGAFAGEFAADTKVPYLDYTWEWINAYAIEDSAPFRYVFPDVRLNANVGHPRAAVIGFADGALLNLMPAGMRTEMIADHPELARTIRRLAVLRRRFLRYFVDGEYRFREGLHSDHAGARIYSCGQDALLILFNPSDQPVQVRSRVDPSVWGGDPGGQRAELTRLDNSTAIVGDIGADDELLTDLEPDGLALIELRAAGGREAS